MGYPRDLDDYDDEELQGELDRRLVMRQQGCCDYCKSSDPRKVCGQRDRHRLGTTGRKVTAKKTPNPILEKANEVLPIPAVPTVIRRRLPRLGGPDSSGG